MRPFLIAVLTRVWYSSPLFCDLPGIPLLRKPLGIHFSAVLILAPTNVL